MKHHSCPACLTLFLVVSLIAVQMVSAEQPLPYKRMLDDPLDFTGEGGSVADPAGLEQISIGLFAPAADSDPLGEVLVRGVQMALDQANLRGGYRGVPFRLVRRWGDTPWGAGSREMTRLAYQDRVWAVIGFVDGSSNVAQQVAVKAWLPVVAPIAADVSLTHARVPWIFRLPPNDQLQAEVLVKEGLVARNIKKVGLVTSVGHDGRIFAKNMKRALAGHGVSLAFHLPVVADMEPMGTVAAQIRRFDSDGLILHLPPSVTSRLLAALTTAGVDCAVCLPWRPGLDPDSLRSGYRGMIISMEPFHPSGENSRYHEFRLAYGNRFGTQPSATAVYGYDAAQLIISAVNRRGLTRIGIREELVNLSGYQGVSGPIEWDNGGGNRMVPVLRMWLPRMAPDHRVQ